MHFLKILYNIIVQSTLTKELSATIYVTLMTTKNDWYKENFKHFTTSKRWSKHFVLVTFFLFCIIVM